MASERLPEYHHHQPYSTNGRGHISRDLVLVLLLLLSPLQHPHYTPTHRQTNFPRPLVIVCLHGSFILQGSCRVWLPMSRHSAAKAMEEMVASLVRIPERQSCATATSGRIAQQWTWGYHLPCRSQARSLRFVLGISVIVKHDLCKWIGHHLQFGVFPPVYANWDETPE